VEAYAAFGKEWGLAFQIVDDILGIWGDPSVTGKSAASDILEKKKTLPLLYALQWERERGHDDLMQLYMRPSLSPKDLETVLGLLARAGALDYARREARLHQERALAQLERTGLANPAQNMLRELALSTLDRSS